MVNPKFKIGDSVEAVESFIDYGDRSDYKTEITTMHRKRKGVIIGAVYRYKGKRTFTGDTYVFEPSESVLFWQIRESYINKPFEALERDITPLNTNIVIPWKKSTMTEEDKKVLSEIMVEDYYSNIHLYPRDEKGRFIKVNA